jgi:hypothetical protein
MSARCLMTLRRIDGATASRFRLGPSPSTSSCGLPPLVSPSREEGHLTGRHGGVGSQSADVPPSFAERGLPGLRRRGTGVPWILGVAPVFIGRAIQKSDPMRPVALVILGVVAMRFLGLTDPVATAFDGRLAHATVSIGRWQTGPPFDRFPNSSPADRNNHALIPDELQIRSTGRSTSSSVGFTRSSSMTWARNRATLMPRRPRLPRAHPQGSR